jgi:hypothetical protein
MNCSCNLLHFAVSITILNKQHVGLAGGSTQLTSLQPATICARSLRSYRRSDASAGSAAQH